MNSPLPSYKVAKLLTYQITNLPSSNPPFPGRLEDRKRPLKELHMLAQTDRHLHTKTTQKHCDLETESVQWADLIKINKYFSFQRIGPLGRICLLVEMSVCMFVCLSVCPSHFLTPFNGIFAPISRSPMSKFFRFPESLGKSNVKKWFLDLKTFAHKGCKIAAAKQFLQIFFSFVHSF